MTYLHGYYDTMDAGCQFPTGEISVISRMDDVISVAGHRISGGALEEAILEHQFVADCAVIPVQDRLKGQIPIAFCVLTNDFCGSYEQVVDEVVKIVREDVGAVAFLKKVIFVPKLPKTRSGKTARNTLTALAASRPFKIPVTIEDDQVYQPILVKLQEEGFGANAVIPSLSK